jgi:DNA-binding beta-propeller fold protein YncE
VGPDGAIYIADTYNNRIRKIFRGTITTVAGTGEEGSSGDAGPALQATMRLPHDVAVDDATGIVYVADANNNLIRAIGSDGVISTVAGAGDGGFDPTVWNASLVDLRRPKGIAVAEGRLFIADSDNHVIRRVNLDTGYTQIIAGNGTPGYSGDGGAATEAQINTPQRLAVDDRGRVYFTDTKNNVIRRIGAGTITTVAGTGVADFSGDGGPATKAALDNPRGVAVDSSTGTLYIGDSENCRIRAVDLSSGVITTFAGTGEKAYTGNGGPAREAALWNPRGLTIDNAGGLLIADVMNNAMRRIAP